MLSPLEKSVFVLVILATAGLFLAPLYRRYLIVRAGRPENRADRIGRRIVHALGKILFQRCTLKNERRWTGLAHAFIFYSALTFDTMTVNHTLEGFIPGFFLFGEGRAGLFFSAVVDLMAVLVLLGVFFFAFRRFIVRPKAYRTTPGDSAVIYAALILLTLSYLYFEAFAIAHEPGTARLSFLGTWLAGQIQGAGLSSAAVAGHFKAGWWLHILIVYAFIAYVPHSKYLHMFAGSLNVLVREPGSGRFIPTFDLEKSEVFGLEKAADFTWKDNLDAFACMECGRCQDVCPAFQTGKPLSPKKILLDQERHLLESWKSPARKRREALPSLVPNVHAEDEIWACTTCGACMHVCPVEIEHIRKIVGMRQNRVLAESKFPAELNAFFRNIETNSNPWGVGFAKRADWAEGLGVQTMAERPEAEYLFWVGCSASFDEEGKKIARALARCLEAAGLDFAILGPEEKCCGDSARRLGNEYLAQTLAAETVETIARYKVRNILTVCPHGYNAFKHEYPRLLEVLGSVSPEAKDHFRTVAVHHHAAFLRDLIAQGRLKVRPEPTRYAYHDPCYLGRHNGVLDPPRDLLGRTAGKPVELSARREHSFCCGAGGGLMWTEEKLGTRVNHKRTDEVLSSGAKGVATACPFCATMLRDGLKDKARPEIQVRDLAEIVAQAVDEGRAVSAGG
ncbi:MAG: 4Fe-4S dicluster domain-containing protein [Candidatus Aminicenantes bacterium]|nr:4Fe-4S dicluster domain-containing protein [Candidatus Aminicenantes bacterium]